MGLYEQVIQFFNLLLPAWVLGLGVVAFSAILTRWGWPRACGSLVAQWLLHGGVGSAVIMGGLWLFGVDGKMAMYVILVLTLASIQWLLCRAWRD
jgi:hypothetical protein